MGKLQQFLHSPHMNNFNIILGSLILASSALHGAESSPGSIASEVSFDASALALRHEQVKKTVPYGGVSGRITLRPLDLSRVPTEEELRLSGQLGSPLSPVGQAEPMLISDTTARERQAADNLAFGRAMQEWNKHNYSEAVRLFKAHHTDFPSSPWAGESVLHMGCEAQFNGRWDEALGRFEWIIDNLPEGSDIYQKALLRRAVLLMERGDFNESIAGFRLMLVTEASWQRRTYAQNWIRQLSAYKGHQASLRNCGGAAIAHVFRMRGDLETATGLSEMAAFGDYGFTLEELEALANASGLKADSVRVSPEKFETLSFPFIAHYKDEHFVTVEGFDQDGNVKVFDSRVGRVVSMSRDSFLAQWSGLGLLLDADEDLPEGIFEASSDDLHFVGGCCGLPRPEDGLGTCREGKAGCGLPVWSVNPVNFNLLVQDTPLWYDPVIGPEIHITLTYNSQDALNQLAPFGNKWTFNYCAYAMEAPGGAVTIIMGSGRRDVWTPDGGGGYTPPPGKAAYKLLKTGAYAYDLTLADGTVYEFAVPPAMPPGTTNMLLVAIKDTYGQAVRLKHDANGALVGIWDARYPAMNPADPHTEISYDATTGLVAKITGPYGREATFSYEEAAVQGDGGATTYNLVGQTDMGGIAYSYGYDENPEIVAPGAYMSSITLPYGSEAATTQFLIEPADADTPNGFDKYPPIGGLMWENYRITITDPLGHKSEYYYDGYSRDGYIRDANQYDPTVGPMFSGAVATKLDYTFLSGSSGAGMVSRITHPDGTYINYSDFNGNKQPRLIKDEEGNETSVTYNTSGQILTVTDARSNVTRFAYADSGAGLGLDLVEISSDSANLRIAHIDYNAHRQPQSVFDAMGVETYFTYNATNGLLESVTYDRNGSDELTLTYERNSLGQIEYVKNGAVTLSSMTYDTVGRVDTIMDVLGVLRIYDYDDLNRLTTTTYPDGTYTENVWTPCCGLLEKFIDRNGNSTQYFYDANRRVTAEIDAERRITAYSYEPNGNLESLTDGEMNTTTWEYDARNRVTKRVYPDGTFVEYGYDDVGNVTAFTNARGQIVQYDYDDVYNRTKIYGAVPTVEFLDFDALNRPGRMLDQFGTTLLTYDDLNRVNTVNGPWADDLVDYDYDNLGRLTSRLINGVGVSAINYDALSRIEDMTNALGQFEFAYQGNSALPSRIDYPSATPGMHTDYSYDLTLSGEARLTQIHNQNATGGLLSRFDYEYDAVGNIKAWERRWGSPEVLSTYRFGYDTAHQLTRAVLHDATGAVDTNFVYGYDAAGNRVTEQTNTGPVTATHNTLNQLTELDSGGQMLISGTVDEPAAVTVSSGAQSVDARMYAGNVFEAELDLAPGTHDVSVDATDVNNNTTSKVWRVTVAGGVDRTLTYDLDGNLLSDEERTYEWDALNRLVAINYTGTNKRTEFTYDGFGNRARIKELDGLTTTTNNVFIWCGDTICQKRDATGATVVRDYYAVGFVEGTSRYFYTFDHLGSIREIVAANGTTVTARYDYDPWGNVIEVGAITVGSDFLYTGHFYHGESELFLAKYRAYSPEFGRWLSRDVLEYAELLPEGPNLYGYAGNNPISWVDRLGLTIQHEQDKNGNNILRDSKTGKFRSKKDFNKQLRALNAAKKDECAILREVTDKIKKEVGSLVKGAAKEAIDLPDFLLASPAITTEIIAMRAYSQCLKCLTETAHKPSGCHYRDCNKLCNNAKELLQLAGQLAEAAL
ncbi:MAG: RHS repeat-associated core domain-containing protein [Opitutales bacterium]